ncbi:MAG TPA: hypothetical protein VEX15_00355 [Nocardioidaceae bacterium]|nr:hypothetical protein [Nocardioidaceae bacterium]
MDAGSRRIFLHVGLYKTGTTFLQNLWRANRGRLAQQGVYYPGGRDGPVQIFAVSDLFGRRPRGGEDRIEGRWDELTEAVGASPHPVTLISDESLSLATVGEARRAAAGFTDREVHVVVTVRDLGRALVSSWQESVKSDETWTWQDFVDRVRDPAVRNQFPARSFWIRQDLTAVLESWQAAVPRERIHVVTVPPPGAPKDLLVERVGEVVGYDAANLTETPTSESWDNRAMAAADAEVLRRFNQILDHRLNERQYHRIVKRILAPRLAQHGNPGRVGLSPDDRAWVAVEARRIVDDLTAGGYQVVGDVSDLIPAESQTGPRPDAATTDEKLDAALHGLAELAEEYATLWWDGSGARPDSSRSADRRGGGWRSRIRATRFRTKRGLLSLADRSRVAAGALNGYVRLREARRRRAASRS